MHARFLVGCTVLVGAIGLSLLPYATAQSTAQSRGGLQGRGVVQGSAFTKGRVANVTLSIDGDNIGLELAEQARNGARVQYRGILTRKPNSPTNSGSFTLNGRVRNFTTSTNLRVINNTTGNCRIEVFNSIVTSSNCNSVAPDSSTQFLGLEQF